jgi:hypothetical protein
MAQRVTNDASLTLGEGSPKARVTSDASLVLGEGSPKARVSEAATLVLIDAAINPSTITPIIFCST